jgi:predicted nucleic acid-binding protein
MTVIVDANILISVIINPISSIAEIILLKGDKIDFVIPEFTLEEINLHKSKICKHAGISASHFDDVLKLFSSYILKFSSDSVGLQHIKAADAWAASIDNKDVLYVAFTLALDALLWTGDLKLYRGLRKKGFANVVTTKEIAQIIKGLH